LPIVPVRSVAELSALPRFNADLYLKQLASARLGHVILSAASLPSTQTLLHLNGAAVPSDTLCVADQQKAGKGVNATKKLHDQHEPLAALDSELRLNAQEQGAAATAGSHQSAASCFPSAATCPCKVQFMLARAPVISSVLG